MKILNEMDFNEIWYMSIRVDAEKKSYSTKFITSILFDIRAFFMKILNEMDFNEIWYMSLEAHIKDKSCSKI